MKKLTTLALMALTLTLFAGAASAERAPPYAMLKLGIEAYNSGENDRAFELFNQTVQAYPNLAETYYYRGLAHLAKGMNAEAMADFEKHLELDPGTSKAGEVQQFLEYLKSLN